MKFVYLLLVFVTVICVSGAFPHRHHHGHGETTIIELLKEVRRHMANCNAEEVLTTCSSCRDVVDVHRCVKRKAQASGGGSSHDSHVKVAQDEGNLGLCILILLCSWDPNCAGMCWSIALSWIWTGCSLMWCLSPQARRQRPQEVGLCWRYVGYSVQQCSILFGVSNVGKSAYSILKSVIRQLIREGTAAFLARNFHCWLHYWNWCRMENDELWQIDKSKFRCLWRLKPPSPNEPCVCVG